MDRLRGNKADRLPFEPVGSQPLFQGRNYKETAMILPLTITSRLASLSSNALSWTSLSRSSLFGIRLGQPVVLASAFVAACLMASASPAHGQVMMYETLQPVTSYYSPMAAGYPGGYMANYSPAGNYAAVTAFSPPMATAYVANYPVANYSVANYPVTQVANYAVETVASPVGVTSYYAPAPVYAAPVYAAPMTTYYAPAAVAVPLYRRGLFGGLRPARTAMYIPY